MSSEFIAATVVYALLAIVCIGSNSLVCYIIMTRKLTHHVLKYYILSLSFTDFFVGIFSVPLYTAYLTNTVPVTTVKMYLRIYTGLDITLGASSVFHLCLMSIDRAVAITKPFLHRTYKQEKKFVVKLLAVPWLMAVICAIPVFIGWFFPIFPVVVSIVTFILPTLVIIICYIFIFVAIKRRNVTNDVTQINECKLLRTVVLVVVIFMVCWVPFHIFNILYGLNSLGLNFEEQITAVGVFKFLHYLNSACNPFIYAFFHPNFRAPMIAILRNLRDCKKKATNRNLRRNTTKRQEFADINLLRRSINNQNRNLPQGNIDSPKKDVKEVEFPATDLAHEKHEKIGAPNSKRGALNSKRGCINKLNGEDINYPSNCADKQVVAVNTLKLRRMNEADDTTDKHEEVVITNFKRTFINQLNGEDINYPSNCANKQVVAGNILELRRMKEGDETMDKHEEVVITNFKRAFTNQLNGEDINCPQNYTNKQEIAENSLKLECLNEVCDTALLSKEIF